MNDSALAPFRESVLEFYRRLAALLPDFLLLLVVLASGIIAGAIVRFVTRMVLRAVKFDQRAERIGLAPGLRRAGLQEAVSTYLARLAGLSILLVFFIVGGASLRIPGTANLLERALELIPALFIAIVILIAGFLVTQFLGRAALIAAVNAGYRSPKLISRTVRAVAILLTVSMALEQLSVARGIVIAAFSIVFGGLVLALAIAFGLGGRHLAREYLRRNLSLPPEERPGSEIEPL
ncbi:MAG TPA: hypothetical protein VIL97_07870 [Thermoanaerobaculia bacterium]